MIDAALGVIERGTWNVADAVKQQPWLPDGPDPAERDLDAPDDPGDATERQAPSRGVSTRGDQLSPWPSSSSPSSLRLWTSTCDLPTK